MKRKSQKYGEIFGISINGTLEDKVLEKIRFSFKNKRKLFITTPNPEILLEARSNNLLYKALENSDIRICDGVGLQMALRMKGFKSERIRGRELMIKLFEIANEQKLKVYLLGSRPNSAKASLGKLISEYPNIKVKGSSGPMLDKKAKPIDGKNESLEKEVLREIKKFRPDVLVVAFGAPKQEIWINKFKDVLPVRVFMTVGGALDVFSGVKSVPPKLVANLGLEWLWRVVHEPRRILRIFRAVVVFPIMVVFEN